MRIVVLVCVLAAACPGADGPELSGNAAYLFDGFVAHMFDADASIGFSLRPGLRAGATVQYMDATQEPVQGLARLRGRIVSGMADMSWRTLKNRLLVDVHAGIDGILEWKVKPRLEGKLEATLPLPMNPVIQNVKLSPRGWYKHRTPNGAAIQNHIALYGYAAELSAMFGPKMAAALTWRREFYDPADEVLDTNFIETWIPLAGEKPLDTLQRNAISAFSAYVYRQVLTPLYLGYAFSYTDSRHNRLAYTGLEYGPPAGGRRTYVCKSAVYPYPTPDNMLAHLAVVAMNFNITKALALKANVAFPVYSRQEISYLPETTHNLAILSYPDQVKTSTSMKFTGPLTMGAQIDVTIAEKTKIALIYNYFGFPYGEWQYFTGNSYSLHTVKLTVKQIF